MNQQDNNLANPLYQSVPGNGTTFGRLPLITTLSNAQVDIAVLGIPFDSLVTYRPGARFGPNAIRQSSVLCRSYSQQMEVEVYSLSRVGDAGDVSVNPFDYLETFRQIEAKIAALQNIDASVVSLGGDHSILLPILRAMSKKYSNLTLIQFDAHTDTSDGVSLGSRHHHGTSIRRAIEEGVIQGDRIFQIGIRGTFGSASYNDFAKQAGIKILDMKGAHNSYERELFIQKIREVAGDDPCYLTFDIDGIDPAFAPGTGTPVVGGLTSFEALDIMHCLKGLQFIGGDVVEVAPAYDHSEITSLLGAAIAFELMALIAIARQLRPVQIPALAPTL
ncbi:MAG: agmatinase [Blastocatellia bacterium]